MHYYDRRRECYNSSSTAIDEHANVSGFSLFPNPTTGNVNVSFNTSNSNATTIVVLDVLGKEIYNQTIEVTSNVNHKTIDLKAFSNGLYFVKIINGNDQVIQKIIKN